MEIVVI